MMASQTPYITLDAAAYRWSVSTDTIRRLIAAGKITGYRLNGRIIRVDQHEVDACFREIPTVRQAGGAA
jgi:excisionase family DNA binding protein